MADWDQGRLVVIPSDIVEHDVFIHSFELASFTLSLRCSHHYLFSHLTFVLQLASPRLSLLLSDT